MLGSLEQLVLLAILRAGKNAYGVTIAAEIEQHAGHVLTLATIYKTLSRLAEKSYVSTTTGDSTPVRGGKAKRFYALTPQGRQELVATLSAVQRMTPGLDLETELA